MGSNTFCQVQIHLFSDSQIQINTSIFRLSNTNLTIIELTMWPCLWPCVRVCSNRLLKWLMSPSPISQVMFASAILMNQWFFHIFGIHSFYATVTLLNIWICMQWTDAADGGCGGGQCDVNIPSLSPRGSLSKAVANDYRQEYHHGWGLWTLVYIKTVIFQNAYLFCDTHALIMMLTNYQYIIQHFICLTLCMNVLLQNITAPNSIAIWKQ